MLQSSRWQCHHSCSEVCVCGVLVHFIVFLLCVHEMRNNTNVRILCTGVFGGILLSCACVCMCLCLCMRACVSVGLMLLSPCGNPSPTLPLPIQTMPSVGEMCHPSAPLAPCELSWHLRALHMLLFELGQVLLPDTHTHSLPLNEL